MTATILIVDDEENARRNISSFLTSKGYEVLGAATLAEARSCIQRSLADIILLDVVLPDGYGPDLLYETAQIAFRPPIILITAYPDIDMAVEAMKNGACDFLQKPINFEQLEKSVQRAGEIVSMRRELNHLRNSLQKNSNFIVGDTQDMHQVINLAQRAAAVSANILITGETGTGKEVLAQYIHKAGPRANKPFIAINCAAIQNTMLESELFGYEAGAFTGAERRKNGLMEVADGGILFLDEIASMPPDIQAKILRVIEERAFRRVGGTNLLHVDVQILAASNRNLDKLIELNQFREDLYFRLKVVEIRLPPLRNRKADIPELVGLFIRLNNARMGLNITDITPRALQALMNYDWPGNIRELSNFMERAALFCDEPAIDLPHLPLEITQHSA
jgi:two-component system, NtrC family, response regulator AtoC